MPGQREVKCDFFRITQKDNSEFSFADCGRRAMSLPSVESRNWKQKSDYIRLIQFQPEAIGGCYGGVLVRIRPNAVPTVCSLDSDALEELSLDERSHLADLMHFLYVPELDIIVAERNKNVGSGHVMCDYITGLLQEKRLECEFFADSGSLEKFRRMHSITSVGIKAIYDYDAFDFNQMDVPLQSIVSLGEKFGACEFAMQFSVGRKRKILTAEIRDYVNRVLGWEGKVRPRAVIVKGSDEASTSYLLNLTKRKFDIVEQLGWTEDALPATKVWGVLYNAYSKVKDQLGDLGGGAK